MLAERNNQILPGLPRRAFLQRVGALSVVALNENGLAKKPSTQEFFWQAGKDGRGFFVKDNQKGKFLEAFHNLGGADFIGFPVSERFEYKGKVFQLFQKFLLAEGGGKVSPYPLLELLHQHALDKELFSMLQVPPKEEEASIQPDIKLFYEQKGGSSVFGKAQSPLVNFGTFAIQRFENAALQLWQESVTGMPDKGTVVPVNAGGFIKDKGIFPSEAFVGEYGVTETSEVVWRGRKDLPYVFLTIDDFWDPSMLGPILNIAQDYQIKLTFFPVGRAMVKRPDLWLRARAEGHSIQNHTQNHRRLPGLSDDQIRWEILTQRETVRTVLDDPGYEQGFLRPPAGAGIVPYEPRIPRICQELGYKVAMWSADSNGYRRHPSRNQDSVKATVEDILKNFYNGSIVLQHALQPDIEALVLAAKEARQRGYFSLTMPEGFTG